MIPSTDPRTLREEIRRDEDALRKKKEYLKQQEARCDHHWGETQYDPIVREGYYDLGDPPGVGGVDRRLPSSVPRSEQKRWKRICKKCGKVEYTGKEKKLPQPTVPDFGDPV